MRFLLDENTHIKLLNWFVQAGHDAIRVPDGLKNGKVIALACSESRVLVTHDKDFGDAFVYPPKNHLGIVLLRIHPPSLPKILVSLEALLKDLPSAKFTHQLIILEEHGYHLLS